MSWPEKLRFRATSGRGRGRWSLLLAVAIAAGCGGEAAQRTLPESLAREWREAPRTGAGAAAAYALARRRPLAPEIDPRRSLRRARRHMDSMPRFSSRRGAFVDGFGAAGAGAALDEWEWLGPGNIGGRTRALVIHPRKPRIMWAAGVSGGVWKTTNKGKRWRAVGDEMANLAVNALAIDPADPDVLYAGTGEGYFREVVRGTGLPLRGAGIFKTVDGGDTWKLLRRTRGARFHWVNDLVVSPRDPSRLYAATRKGVFRSLDGGERWKRVLNPRVEGGCLDLAQRADTPGDFLLASCGTFERATVYRNVAAETGGPWSSVLSEPAMGRTSLAISPSDPEVVYALAASNVPGPGGRFEQALHAVFRSRRGGERGSWEARVRNADPRKLNTLLLSNPIIAALEECGFEGPNEYLAMGWYVNVIAVDPTDPERVWAGGVDLFRSDDGGRSWNPATYWWFPRGSALYVHADQHGLVFHPRRRGTLYSLNDGGVYRTTNAGGRVGKSDVSLCGVTGTGVRWTSLNNNYGVTQFYHGVAFGDGGYLGGTQDNGTVLGDDGFGANGWRRILGGDGGYSAVDPDNPRVIYASFQNGVVQKSVNGGGSFTDAVVGITDLALNEATDFRGFGPAFLFIAPLRMDPNDSSRLWLGGRRLWRTDNGAQTWAAASAILPDGGKTSALAVAPGDSDRVLAGTQIGNIHRSDRASSAGEATEWPASRPRSGFVTSVAYDPQDPGTAYATYGGFGGRHVWRSDDGGASWSAIDGAGATGLPDVPAHVIVIDPDDTRRLYLGTDVGVFVSLDGGAHWAVENTGFAAAVTEALAIAEGPGGQRRLFAFTHGRGAWRVELE